MGKLFEFLVEWLKSSKNWKRIQPFVLLGFGYVTAEILAFEYIQSQYGFTPSFQLFLGSYYFFRITAVFVGLAVLLAVFQHRAKPGESSRVGRMRSYLQRHQSLIALRLLVSLTVVIGVAVAFRQYGPQRVSTIRVKLLNELEELKPDALAYMIYELNRQQKSWFFELDFDPFNPAKLKSIEAAEAARHERRMLYYAELTARGKPLIAITEEPLGKAFFCEHRTNVSVISTFDKDYAPLTVYEYLAYCLIVQSMLIHLDVYGGGLPEGAFEPGTSSHGGIFQFNPTRDVLKASILAARLSPDEEALLFNRFGADYMNVCRRLLTLEWLRSERVVKNLATHFGVTNVVSSPVRVNASQDAPP